MKKQSFSTTIDGKHITAEISDLTEQAGGSVLLYCGETVILVTAVMSQEPKSDLPFLPLSVEFEEKFYAAGAILGSRFQRREGRPSEEAVLSARMVDRTIRPLFDPSFRHEVQVVITVLAMGEDDPDVLGIIGASLALHISPIPWHGPIGAVRIGRTKDSGEILINPTYLERAEDKLDFEILSCGKDNTINMIETRANEISEADVTTVLETATEIHTTLINFQEEIAANVGKDKITHQSPVTPDALNVFFTDTFADQLYNTIFSNQAGKQHITKVKKEFITAAVASEYGSAQEAASLFEEKVDAMLHEGVIHHRKRADGRDHKEVRELYAQAGGVSPVLHGSGIFYRGGTHIFSALTLGGPSDAQYVDTIEEQSVNKRFMHHYNFPPFSVGETGRVGGFNRRMIGHGALAEKALLPVLPDKQDFPYTIRLVSETMASNGSSSMGSVCASSLALMDGGVPITRPVAGIASGVMIDGGAYALLTDIQGPEDEHGDMDLKVAGTEQGITAIQMDVKVTGIPLPIIGAALEDAKVARLHILDTMQAVIAAPRSEISPRAPHIKTLAIKPEQIGLVIGGGGKTINAIKERSGVEEIQIEDDGTVFITGNKTAVEIASEEVLQLTKEYLVGEQYQAIILNTASFGAFASFDDGKAEGLIHISEISPKRVEVVTDLLQTGARVPVKVIKSENGKIALSIKQADPNFFSNTLDNDAQTD